MNKSRRRFTLNLLGSFSLASTGLLAGCMTPQHHQLRAPILPGSNVLALGDSITYGIGATSTTTYPYFLSKLTGWNVINGGVPGNYALQALQRLPKLLDKYKPQLVITSIGVNDFANEIFNTSTFENIQKIDHLIDKTWAQHVIIANPDLRWPHLALAHHIADHPLYKQFAEEMNVPLIENVLTDVLADHHFLADKIHPNAQGYAVLAKNIALYLQKINLLNYIQWDNYPNLQTLENTPAQSYPFASKKTR